MKQIRIIGVFVLCFLFLGCSRQDKGNETSGACPETTCPKVECPACPELTCPNVEENMGDEEEIPKDENISDNEANTEDESTKEESDSEIEDESTKEESDSEIEDESTKEESDSEIEDEPTTDESTQTHSETYVIQAGDTLKSIAEKLGVTVEQLQTWNNISDPNKIFVGQVLTIKTSQATVGGIDQIIENYVNELKANNNVEASAITHQTMFQNERLVSILFSGDVASGAYPRPLKATLNFDLEQDKRLSLNQLVSLDADFTEQVTLLFQEQFDALGVDMRAVLTSDIATYLSQADQGIAPDIQSYVTSSELVLILSIPHAIGDYLEVRMPLTSLDFIF